MHVMLEQRHRNFFFWLIANSFKIPWVTVVSATAYNTGIQLGTLPRWGHSCWKMRGGHHDSDFVVEQRDGQWIMNIAYSNARVPDVPAVQSRPLGGMPMA